MGCLCNEIQLYGAGIVRWTKNDLDEINGKTRRAMPVNKELHPKSNVDGLYVSRTKGGRGLNTVPSENVVRHTDVYTQLK